jgi:hypothetical protein
VAQCVGFGTCRRDGCAARRSAGVDHKRARTSFENTSIGQQISGDVDLRGQKIVVKAPKGSKKAAR